jgi:mono/diheme cytochrome c family protein
MLRQPLLVALIAVSALAPLGAHADDKLLLKSVNVDLPFGDRTFPGGPGSDAVNGNCLACHSAGMVLNQPALSQAQWRAEVEKMRTAYKAPIDPKDVDAIVGYLVGIRAATDSASQGR